MLTREELITWAREDRAMALEQGDKDAIRASGNLLQRLGDEKFLAETDAIPTALYRHFDSADRLLYVGISLSIIERTMAHRSEAPWYRNIATIKIEWFGSRSLAEAMERKAIENEKPLHNIVHNSKTASHAST